MHIFPVSLALKRGEESPQAWPTSANDQSFSRNPLAHSHSFCHISKYNSAEISRENRDSKGGI